MEEWNTLSLSFFSLSLSPHTKYFLLFLLEIISGLEIETGISKGLAREHGLCPICALGVEDELHFLVLCPMYQEERDKWWVAINTRISFVNHPADMSLVDECRRSDREWLHLTLTAGVRLKSERSRKAVARATIQMVTMMWKKRHAWLT